MTSETEYYRNVMGNFSRTVTDEVDHLVKHASRTNPEFESLDYNMKEEVLKDLYIGQDVLNKYSHIKSISIDSVFPRFRQKQGSKKEKIFDPTLGHVKYLDEFSGPFTGDYKSLEKLF